MKEKGTRILGQPGSLLSTHRRSSDVPGWGRLGGGLVHSVSSPWGLSAGDRLARDPVGSPMLGGGCRTLIGCPRIASSAPHWGGAWIALFQGAQ